MPDADHDAPTGSPAAGRTSRIVIFVVIAAACTLVAVGVVAVPLLRGSSDDSGLRTATGPLAAAAARTAPYVAFEDVSSDDPDHHLALVSVGTPRMPLTVTPLRCQRLDIAGGRGLCLRAEGASLRTAFRAQIFAPDFTVLHTISLGGLLSRARVSPDGRYGAVTAFLAGHSYAESGQFSTSTTLLDLTTGRKLFNLEKLSITRNGRPFRAVDFNYWGVTFANDGTRLYATLASGHKTYLVEADLRTRRGRVIRENVECPSLSPDNTRIAFKKRVDSENGTWRFTVLDLRTMRETPLSETRSVDDQIAWLGDDRVLYGYENAVWIARADGSGRPRLYLPHASSPTVVQPVSSVVAGSG